MAAPTVSTTTARDDKALALFARCADWQQGHTKDGRSFFAIPGSEANAFHMTDTRNCSCQDRQQRGVVCKHMRAVRLWTAAFKTGSVAPKPRTAALADERITLTPEGAAYLVEMAPPADPHADCQITDETRAHLDRLRAEQRAERNAVVRVERDSWIARLETCIAAVDARQTAKPRATYAELFAAELAEAL